MTETSAEIFCPVCNCVLYVFEEGFHEFLCDSCGQKFSLEVSFERHAAYARL